MAAPGRINFLLAICLAVISGAGLISSSLNSEHLQDSFKMLVRDPFRALDKELTRMTSSNELKENRAAARRMLEHKSTPSVDHKHKSTLKQLAKALVELRGDEDHNIESLCSAHNLANLRLLVGAMAKSSKQPTREPESRRRLNLLLVKQTNSVRSFCYAHLSKKWDAQVSSLDTLTFNDRRLSPLDNVPFSYLFRDELKRHKQQDPSRRHEELVPLIEHLRHLQEQSERQSASATDERPRQHQLVLEVLVKPCQRLTRDELAREILQPRVDLTAIELVVYHQADMARRDYSSHSIGPLSRFIMCQKLLAPASSTQQHLLTELLRKPTVEGGEREKRTSVRLQREPSL